MLSEDAVLKNRRPLKSRNTALAKKIAAYLCKKNLKPNDISLASMAFAFCAGLFLASSHLIHDSFFKGTVLILAALMIQGRLACNLFDGMVAVEGKKSGPSGELYNDVPDRFADAFILIGLGYGASGSFAYELGYLGAIFAILTAYVRTLSSSLQVPVRYLGPMAKQHRMALVTFACVLSLFESSFTSEGKVFYGALWVVNIGCMLTIYRRLKYAKSYLESTKYV